MVWLFLPQRVIAGAVVDRTLALGSVKSGFGRRRDRRCADGSGENVGGLDDAYIVYVGFGRELFVLDRSCVCIK